MIKRFHKFPKTSNSSSKVLSISLVFFLSVTFSINVLSQTKTDTLKTHKNTLFVEFFGSSVYVYNLTYDRIIKVDGLNKITASLGAQFFPKLGLLEDPLISFSPQINYLRGNEHNFELGIGVAFNLFYQQWGIPLRIGYRYQPSHKGFFFRAGFTPIITNSYPENGSDFSFLPWAGVGLGHTF